MVTLNLTDEQAKFLKEHLSVEIENARWGQEGTLRDDNLEHAQTIHDKITKELDSRKW